MDTRPDSRWVAAAGLVAVGASVLASAGDIMLLWSGAQRTAGQLGPDTPVLVSGHYLGVLCIPLYAVGYWLAAGAMGASRTARWVFRLGCYTGAVGAAIHGVTALIIETAAPGQASALSHLGYLLPLWGVLFVCTAVASALYAVAVFRGGTTLPKWAAAANPLALVLLISLAALPFPAAAAYIVPASANLAHIAFFGLVAALRLRPARTP